MSRIGTAFSRLSRREKVLVSGGALLLVGGVFVLLNVLFDNKIDKLEKDIAQEQADLLAIYGATDEYLVAQKRFETTRDQARRNANLTLTTAVAEMANTIVFDATDNRNNPLGRKHLKDFLEFNALKEKPVGPRKKPSGKASDRKQSTEGYYQRDQEFTVKGTVPFTAIYELFERIEESADMLFVTDMRLEKNPVDPDRADNVKFTVSTYWFQDEDVGEAP